MRVRQIWYFPAEHSIIQIDYTNENGSHWYIRGAQLELSDLTAYAEEKYQIEEEHKWPDFPGLSVLCSPDTGKWLALLMRQWDSIHGEMAEVCDIKCGQEILGRRHDISLSRPYRMHGKKWIGIRMGEHADAYTIKALFDRAVEEERKQRFTIELEPRVTKEPAQKVQTVQTPRIPKKIFEMIHLYDFDDSTFEGKCRNFYRQGKFMEDFEDNAPHAADIKHYYTTYHDLNITQLRAYFTWRTRARHGAFEPIALSLAYMYLYELICGIGCRTPQEAFDKMGQFERGFLDAGYGDRRMRTNLHQWMFDFAVVNGLDAETAKRCAGNGKFRYDYALSVLKEPDIHSDEEIFRALAYLYPKKNWETPVISKNKEKGIQLFALAFRVASAERHNFFEECFGSERETVYRPFSNAVWFSSENHADCVYSLCACRKYICKNEKWTVSSYDISNFNTEAVNAFIHAADRIFRKHLKTGSYLRKRADELWAVSYAEKALARQKASLKPKITIHIQSLDKIRQDAATTRDSLLTEEELAEIEETKPEQPQAEPEADNNILLNMLLRGEDVRTYLKQYHLIPSVVTDEINEALFEEIGDSVLSCDGDTITIVEDYRDDLLSIMGENQNNG